MTWHITARMAWHDRKWDGKVCNDPEANSYCTGSHSLLSERLARERKLEWETPSIALDAKLPDLSAALFLDVISIRGAADPDASLPPVQHHIAN